jgi:N-terminal domain of anti-restriction factor ArdC
MSNEKTQAVLDGIEASIERLADETDTYRQSEQWKNVLRTMSHFHAYSFQNQMAILWQKPDATRVAGLYAWNRLGRKVKKGGRGIRILAPVIGVRRKKDEEAEKDTRTQNQAVLVGFRAAYVFERLSRDVWPRFYPLDGARGPILRAYRR